MARRIGWAVQDRPYLKLVSRVKLDVLAAYLEPWSRILGSRNKKLLYFDCFEGGGEYTDESGEALPGSPLRALRIANDYRARYPTRTLMLRFVERTPRTAKLLKRALGRAGVEPTAAERMVTEADAAGAVAKILEAARVGRRMPSFFFIDPYGLPLSIPDMRQLLRLDHVELLVNLMWFRVNMNLANPRVVTLMDDLFGHHEWAVQAFMQMRGDARRDSFIQYFKDQVGAEFALDLLLEFSPEDRNSGKRTKFCLMHFSSNERAALLMNDILFAARRRLDDLLAPPPLQQSKLWQDPSPDEVIVEQLKARLPATFGGQRLTYKALRVRTLSWQLGADRHYRRALQELEHIALDVESDRNRRNGFEDGDLVIFR